MFLLKKIKPKKIQKDNLFFGKETEGQSVFAGLFSLWGGRRVSKIVEHRV